MNAIHNAHAKKAVVASILNFNNERQEINTLNAVLIRDALIATGPYANQSADILLDGQRIVEIGPRIHAPAADLIDASGSIAAPGFIDGHRHLWQTTLRGLLANRVLADYYRRVRVGFATVYTPEDAYWGVYAGALDALSDGVTCVLDHCHIINSPAHADAVVQALRDAGLRALLCYGFYESPVQNPAFASRHQRYDDLRRVRASLASSPGGLITLGAALTESWLAPEETTADEIRTAKDLGIARITLHVGSNPAPTDVDRMRRTGCFGPEFTYSHCNTSGRDFFDCVAQTGGGIVATPETEMGMGMGFPVTAKATDAGIPFGLGADIVSFASGDMLMAARLALQTSRMLHCLPEVNADRMAESSRFTAEDALRWITAEGAKAIGVDKVTGALEAGKSADIVLVDARQLRLTPLPDVATALVMHANSRDVHTVIVDGKVRKKNGHLVGVQVEALRNRLEKSREEILSRVKDTEPGPSGASQTYESLIRGASH